MAPVIQHTFLTLWHTLWRGLKSMACEKYSERKCRAFCDFSIIKRIRYVKTARYILQFAEGDTAPRPALGQYRFLQRGF